MNKQKLLLQRLDEIGQVSKDSEPSTSFAGTWFFWRSQKENDWISTPIWNFFVIVKDGYKTHIQDLTLVK